MDIFGKYIYLLEHLKLRWKVKNVPVDQRVSLRSYLIYVLFKRYSSRSKLHKTTINRPYHCIHNIAIKSTTFTARSQQTFNMGMKLAFHPDKRNIPFFTRNKNLIKFN